QIDPISIAHESLADDLDPRGINPDKSFPHLAEQIQITLYLFLWTPYLFFLYARFLKAVLTRAEIHLCHAVQAKTPWVTPTTSPTGVEA
ncbi:hypothetical protein SB912_29515, partial [Pantoea sp. SIMBA_072]